jgi:hypothetical protein
MMCNQKFETKEEQNKKVAEAKAQAASVPDKKGKGAK